MRLLSSCLLCLALMACGPTTEGNETPSDDDAGCLEGSTSCIDNQRLACRSGVTVQEGACYPCSEGCDADQGLACDVDTGECEGACRPDRLGKSYVGCEYYAVVTPNVVENVFHFTVVVANTSSSSATLTIEGGNLGQPLRREVPAGEVSLLQLPWVEELKLANCDGAVAGCPLPAAPGLVKGASSPLIHSKAAYHVRATQPVAVYQFNPLEYAITGNFSYSNDASLLLPTNTWGQDYFVGSWPARPSDPNTGGPINAPGFASITASEDDTRITVDMPIATRAGPDLPRIPANTPTDIVINQGDVLQLLTPDEWNGNVEDLTGGRLTSSAPIQVISGHACTNVPLSISACDHLEESIFPLAALANEYVLSPPGSVEEGGLRPPLARLVATEDNTVVRFDPKISSEVFLAKAGDVFDLSVIDEDLQIHSDKKIMVLQYMTGQSLNSQVGDPAMSQAVPTAQFRSEYLFHAPHAYDSNFVNVTAPSDGEVELDGVPVEGFHQVGNSSWKVAVVKVEDSATGNHLMTGSSPFGIGAYGYGRYTSYWYPGGTDVRPIIID